VREEQIIQVVPAQFLAPVALWALALSRARACAAWWGLQRIGLGQVSRIEELPGLRGVPPPLPSGGRSVRGAS
jgi:hypothetical protein